MAIKITENDVASAIIEGDISLGRIFLSLLDASEEARGDVANIAAAHLVEGLAVDNIETFCNSLMRRVEALNE